MLRDIKKIIGVNGPLYAGFRPIFPSLFTLQALIQKSNAKIKASLGQNV
jgi:hypothetical protein